MESNSQQPGINDNASNATQASYQQIHNIPPYYPLSTQHSDPVLFNQHGVPQYYGAPQYQHGVLPYQQSTLPMPVVQQGVPPYPYNTLPPYQHGISPHQYNTVLVNQYGNITVPQHSLQNQQTAFPIPQQGVPQYQGSAYHTSNPPSISPSIPHPLPTAYLHLNALSGLPQEGVTGNMQQNIHSISLSPSLRHPSLSSSPSIQVPVSNGPQYDSESRTDQFLHQQQTVSSMNTPPVHFSLIESTQSSPYENIPLPLTTPSDNEAKIIRLDKGGNSSQTHRDDSNNTSQQVDNKEYDPLQSDNHHCETEQNPLASSTQATYQIVTNILDFQMVFEALYPARVKWHNLGVALGLDNTTLECIGEKERNDHDKCLRNMIQKLENTSEKLTWDKISQALETPTVEMYVLAQRVRTLNSPLYIPRHSSSITLRCVSEYTGFLKDKYKQMSIFPDEWPPRLKKKFSNLALIETKQIEIPGAEISKSVEYDYATGNVDNIVTRKKEIKLEQIFNPLSKCEKSNNFIVLMDGAPGVGKTTLTRKICKDWAEGKLLTDHQIVILKPLREMRGHTTASLSDILEADDPELKEQVTKHIQKTSGSGVMFIFDGFDELSSEQQYDTTTLFWKLIAGDKFGKCSVLVTSRSYASDPIQEVNRVNRHVEVLGFKKQDIEHCIKHNITDKKKAEILLQMLKQRLDIVSLCYIPLNCGIVLYIYQQLGTLPDTLTQLYETFILHTIKIYKNKMHVVQNKKGIQQANSLDQFPEKVKEYLNFLSKIAHMGIVKNKLVFEYSELQAKENLSLETEELLKLGLLNTIGELDLYYYQFLHLTIQEFLAARHLASMKSNEELLEFVRTNLREDRFRMTLLFLSGLTQINLSCETLQLNIIDKSLFLLLAHILYESQQTTHNWLLHCLPTNSLDLSKQTLNQFDCLVLVNFLTMTPEDHVWDEINLSQCGLSNRCIQMLLVKKYTKLNIPIIFLTKELIMHLNNTNIDLLTPVLLNESKVQSLTISSINLPNKCNNYRSSDKTLNKIIIHKHEVEQVLITSNEINIAIEICSGVLQKLLQYVAIKSLRQLCITSFRAFEDCFDCGASGNDAWESIINIDIQTCHDVKILKSHFSEEEISFLYEKFKKSKSLHSFKIESKNLIPISLYKLISLQQSTQAMTIIVKVHLHKFLQLLISIERNELVHIEIIQAIYDIVINHDDPHYTALNDLNSILPSLLEENVPLEYELAITSKSFLSQELLTSIKKSKTVKQVTLSIIDDYDSLAVEFQEMLENTQTLQTLTLDKCELSATFTRHLHEGLLHNTAIKLCENKQSSKPDFMQSLSKGVGTREARRQLPMLPSSKKFSFSPP